MWQFVSLGLLGLSGLGLYFLRRIVRGKVIYCECVPRYIKNVIITGANSGIGKAVAHELAKRNWHLILACRDTVKGEKTRLEIVERTGNRNIVVKPLDLSSYESIKQFTDSVSQQKIDVLVNNAGVFAGHFRAITDFGMEEDMAVNHLGHFMLTNELLPVIISQHQKSRSIGKARIVIVSSSLAKKGKLNPDQLDFSDTKYSPHQAYCNSKLANSLFARELHKRFHESGALNVYCLDTGGMVDTGLFRHTLQKIPFLFRPLCYLIKTLMLKTPLQGCQSIVHCCVSDDLENESGVMYSNCDAVDWPKPILNEDLARNLWEKCLNIINKSKVG